MDPAPPAGRALGQDPGLAPERADLLVPYIPRLHLEWLVQAPDRRWRAVDAAVVFVDISGFTKLSEKLAKLGRIGAEEMASSIDRCFAELLEVAYQGNGSLLKFGGDALLLFFPAERDEGHVAMATRAAHGMRERLRTVGKLVTAGGKVDLRMSVGVHAGTFDFFLVGTSHRELLVTGPATTEVVRMESTAEAGEIVVSPAVARALPPRAVGAAKGPGSLLRSAPAGQTHVAPWIVPDTVPDDLLRESVPAQTREYLLAGVGEPEHRRVTVAFLHFDGTDAMIARDGPEATAEELHRLVSDAQLAAERYGVCFLGTDADADGGKLILTAGAPRSLGDDEERMLFAAREIVSAERAIPVRIGVNTGLVFAGDIGTRYRRTYTVMGDTVNLAARVMAAASPGSVYATAPVLEGCSTAFDVTELEPFSVKGKAAPVRAWSVGDPATGTASRHAVQDDLPLVGRDPDLDVLTSALDAARDGRGRFVQIVGPPGIGKTRLMEEIRRRAADLRVIAAACDLYQASTPYGVLRSILREVVGLSSDMSAEEVAEALHGIVGRDPTLGPWLPLLAIPLDVPVRSTPEVDALDPRFRKQRLEEVVGRVLAHLLDRPTLIAIDDGHWIDEVSRDVLLQAARDVEERPWVILVTRRDEGTAFPPAEMPSWTVLSPAPLPPADAARLVELATEEAPLRPDEIRSLAERSGGNPLFLRELTLAAARAGGVDDLPDSVEALVTVQIDRLSPGDRRLLRYASVLGMTFEDGMLAGLSEAPEQRIAADAWERLSEFVAPEGAGHHRFRHALMRDAAYHGLAFRRRRELHARAAEMILGAAETGPLDVAELLSRHYYEAQRFGEAWAHSRIAGDRASEKYANTEAVQFYRRAIDSGKRIGVPPRELASITEALGDVRWRMGAFSEAATAFAGARRLVPDDPVIVASLFLKEAKVPYQAGRYAQAVRLIKRGLRLVESLEDAAAGRRQVELLALFAALRGDQGRLREAERLSFEVIERAGPLDHQRVIAHAYSVLDFVYSQQGRYDGIDYLPLALAIHEERGDLYLQAEVLNNMGINEYYKGRWQRALERYERSRDLRERVGDAEGAAVATNNIAEILVDQGRLEEAEPMFQEALRVFRASGSGMMTGLALSNLGRIAARTGRFDEARDLLGRADERLREVGDLGQLVENQSRVAEMELLQGRWEAAIATARDALAKIKVAGGIAPQVPALHRIVGYALASLGRLDEARTEIERSEEAARVRDASYELALTLHALAELFVQDLDERARWEAAASGILDELGVVGVSDGSARTADPSVET